MRPAAATSIRDGMAVHTISQANDCRTRDAGSLRLLLQIETNIVTNTPRTNTAHSPKNMTRMGLHLVTGGHGWRIEHRLRNRV
jgi:hypothetical protein